MRLTQKELDTIKQALVIAYGDKANELEEKVRQLNMSQHFQEIQVAEAHQILDSLDVPKSDSAFVGHRWYWFCEGKRESNKTKENTEGYSPEEWNKRLKQLDEIQQPPPKPKLPVVNDDKG